MFWFILGGVIAAIQSALLMRDKLSEGHRHSHPLRAMSLNFIWGALSYGTVMWLIFSKWLKVHL